MPLRRSVLLGATTLAFGLGLFGSVALANKPKPKSSANPFEVSPLETRILGQQNWLRGGPASLRVIVLDHLTGKPLKASVSLDLQKLEAGKPVGETNPLFHGETNGLGTLDASFHTPEVAPGSYQVNVDVKSQEGEDTVTQPIQIQEATQVLLTADKPLYQPGQTIHLRALAMDMATRTPLADQPITFEVEDARGNKVFKHKQTLSRFGLASTDFVLADEVNMGAYTLRSILPQGETEKKVQVSRYVLPKFKATLTTDKTYYLPGETVKGTLQANYFFGKPVAEAKAEITVNTIVIGVEKIGEVTGKTDATGNYKFEYTLPKSFVGQPFEQGKAVVEFAVDLKDTADHKQQIHVSVPVVKDPLSVLIVPEHQGLVPDVQNRLFLAAATADGSPLKHTVIRVKRTDAGKPMVEGLVTTDDLGLATYDFKPTAPQTVVEATATDINGRQGSVTQTLTPAQAQDALILRTDKTLAKVGERLNLTALCSQKGGTLYLDVIRNKQTILTHAQAFSENEGRFSLPITADMVGTLELHAYKILPDEQIIRDTRRIIVTPAGDLDIRVALDKTEYRPGADASLKFTVTDSQKHPVLAALGLAMVDESVFALSELQPGLEKIYFNLEKELMEPRYEIHGLKPTDLMQAGPGGIRREEKQRAASMLLASAVEPPQFEIRVDTYQRRWAQMEGKLVERMQQTHQKILNAIQKYHKDTGSTLMASDSLTLLVEKGYLQEADLLDPWGHPYKTNLYNRPDYNGYFTLSSAGPDGKWNTADDVAEVSIYGWNRGGIRFRGGRAGGFGGGLEMDKDAAVLRDVFADRELETMAAPRALAAPAGAGVARFALPQAAAMKRSEGMVVNSASAKADGGAAAPRVREYFPETMYWNPALITDEQGHANLQIPMADSITTWRLSMMANSLTGQLGSATVPVKVFQDFFVDIDLPVSLTQNDRVELPVTVYNYLPTAQEVNLNLHEEPWFRLDGDAHKKIHLDSGQVSVVYYPIVVKALGRHALQVDALGSKTTDAVRRQIEVTPDGKQVDIALNDRLQGKADQTLTLPENAVPGADGLWVKLYPGTFSQVVEGLDGILRMPNGCFEQTSSTTYPNLLVLDYLKANKKVNPEIQMKAEQYINIGYQRLVTFECKNGGFSWFGTEPAHQVLTAYGLLEFSDMAKVSEVDPALIARTQNWLAAQQKADGTWEEKNGGIAEGIINRQTGALRTTAYIAWTLAESGYKGPQLARGIDYVKAHWQEAKDPYTLAVALNLFAKTQKDASITQQVADALIEQAKTDAKIAYWKSDTQTFTGAQQDGADLETTGMAAFGLVKWGRNSGFTNKVLTYLVQRKDSFGTWSSTQGTVWALKSLLYASHNGTGEGKGTVTIVANGQKAAGIAITPEDSDVMRQIDLKEFVKSGANTIHLEYSGEGSLLYQIVGRYYTNWQTPAAPFTNEGPLAINVAYDKKTLAQDDTATVTVTIHNNTERVAEMPLIDLGIPPGFTVVPDNLDEAVKAGKISKYTITGRQVIVYLEKLDPVQTLSLTYQVKAKYPIKAKTPLSKVYPYYNPERVAISAPQEIVVTK